MSIGSISDNEYTVELEVDKENAVTTIKRYIKNCGRILYNITIAEITPIDHNGKWKGIGIFPVLNALYKKYYYTFDAHESKRQKWSTSLFDEATADERHFLALKKPKKMKITIKIKKPVPCTVEQ